MKFYEDFLKKKFKTIYLDYKTLQKADSITKVLKKHKITSAKMFCPLSSSIRTEFENIEQDAGIKIEFEHNPSIITPDDELKEFFEGKEHFSMTSFYIHQRKKLELLVEDGKPIGGKWSFDPQNRKKLPKNIELPEIFKPSVSKYVKEAISYVNQNFPDNPGDTDNFFYPVTFADSDKWLKDFLENRLQYFGDYEDAISSKHDFVYHSVLSPMLNNGLLSPEDVVSHAINRYKQEDISLNNIEGFVRQLVGWREFMRGMYLIRGSQLRKSNFWRFNRRIPSSFYTAQTSIEPLDITIKKVLNNSYLHHIERLMIIGNVMLLCEISPDEVYRWFMELFIDAYDWVMVPNVYGMSQYSDGGSMTTKPYISSSNYIHKMSDYPLDGWGEIWDGLFWRFVSKNKPFFAQNPRMKIMVNLLNKKSKEELKNHITIAEEFLEGMG